MKHLLIIFMLCANQLLAEPTPKGWPEGVEVIKYPTSLDQSMQPMLVYQAPDNEPRPLLVGLHTWSSTYTQVGGQAKYAEWCIRQGWHFVHPNFRGPNNTPDGMGSDLAVQDVLDAVDYMKKHHKVDADRVYLAGVSGGGYGAMLLAGRSPDTWAGVSAWCGISDIREWWDFHAFKNGNYSPGKYAKHIERAVGGRPDQDKAAAEQCIKRSANTHLGEKTRMVNLCINHGVHDGRKGSVPFAHSLHAFNRVVPEADRISEADIESFYTTRKVPAGYSKAAANPLYGKAEPILVKTSGNTCITIFNGGHQIQHMAALNWLAAQRRGKAAVWKIDEVKQIEVSEEEAASGK